MGCGGGGCADEADPRGWPAPAGRKRRPALEVDAAADPEGEGGGRLGGEDEARWRRVCRGGASMRLAGAGGEEAAAGAGGERGSGF